jgi:diaminopimelate decarboxylase
MKGYFPINRFKNIETPFYYYDCRLLQDTLAVVAKESARYGYQVHYAVKANANPGVLATIRSYGLGADCVSGGEIRAALDAGFEAGKIVFAGVGKADWEINLALDSNIFCFNVESIPELKVIDQLAGAKNKIASVALRINPEIDAHTHHHITTGLRENKFGINLSQLDDVLNVVAAASNIRLVGIHFHIGSQITDMEPFQAACNRMTEVLAHLAERNVSVENINFGGGLGIDYQHPDRNSVPDFASYFAVFDRYFKPQPGQQLHFEPGRSIVGQCGSLIARTLYVKEGSTKKFAILDAGFTELIRPALYDAYHKIENISSDEASEAYDVVGPICESSDCFGKGVMLNAVSRGDFVAIRSAGAYGEIMASRYNCRRLPEAYFSDSI